MRTDYFFLVSLLFMSEAVNLSLTDKRSVMAAARINRVCISFVLALEAVWYINVIFPCILDITRNGWGCICGYDLFLRFCISDVTCVACWQKVARKYPSKYVQDGKFFTDINCRTLFGRTRQSAQIGKRWSSWNTSCATWFGESDCRHSYSCHRSSFATLLGSHFSPSKTFTQAKCFRSEDVFNCLIILPPVLSCQYDSSERIVGTN